MGFEQYHEPVNELSDETRTFAHIITSLTEESEAISWYEQRMSVEANETARMIMENAQHEEMKHFGMDLAFLIRQKPEWELILKHILFQGDDIVRLGDEAEEHLEAQEKK